MNEAELFRFLKSNVYYDLELSADQFSKYDCFTKRFKIVMELKSRNTHYNDLMLEKIKYDALIDFKYKPVYVNYTPNGIYFFNLKKLRPVWVESEMPRHTEFENTDKIQKTYCLININEAYKIIKL